jgi:hypothetical protein
MRNPSSAILRCADKILTGLGDFQEEESNFFELPQPVYYSPTPTTTTESTAYSRRDVDKVYGLAATLVDWVVVGVLYETNRGTPPKKEIHQPRSAIRCSEAPVIE